MGLLAMPRSRSRTVVVYRALAAFLCLSLAGCGIKNSYVGELIKHGWSQNDFEGQVLRGREGRGAERLASERRFDPAINQWVELHGRPDYFVIHQGDTIEFCYIEEDRVVEFTRADWISSSTPEVVEVIPDRLSNFFVLEDRQRLAAQRRAAEARSKAAASARIARATRRRAEAARRLRPGTPQRAAPAAPSRPSTEVPRPRGGRLNPDWRIGEKRKLGIGIFKQLVAEHAGWSVWWSKSGSFSPRCYAQKFAFKSSGFTPPWVELVIMLGSGNGKTHVSFEGPGGSEHQGAKIEIDGKYYVSVAESNVPALEGKTADFEVTMGAWEHLNTTTSRGRIDLRGISRAHELVKKCATSHADS